MMIDPVYAVKMKWEKDLRVTRGVNGRIRLEASAWLPASLMTFRLSITLPCNS
jgi:hypothetical protein